jgi:hypothetical protein
MGAVLFKNYTKGILTNRNLWFWGVAFMLFWLVLGAYEFSQGIETRASILAFTSSWYGIIALYSLSSLAISIAYTIYYASSALAYGFRYTKLTPFSYMGSLVGSSSILGIALSAIILLATFGLYSSHFGTTLPPSDPVFAVVVSALGGIFMMSLAMLLVLIVVNYIGLRSINLVTFVPLLLAFGFGYSQLLTAMPAALVYASPYNAIQSLLFQAYSGSAAPVEFLNPAGATLDWRYLFISLLAWIAVLLLADSVLLKRLRPRQLEEGRQI